MTSPAPVVFILDDDDSVRRALARLIQLAGHRVEVFASAREFLAGVNADMRPACLVLDVQLPDGNGIQLQRKLDSGLPVVFISGHGDIAMTVGAMKAGATDFLPKPVSEVDLLRAVGQALERAVQLYERRRELAQIQARLDRLTPREMQVMDLVVRGLMNKQVACELGTAEKTVKTHRARVMKKMEVRSLAELVRVADRVAATGTRTS